MSIQTFNLVNVVFKMTKHCNDLLDLMSMGCMPVGANDVRDVASPFSSVSITTVDQMQLLIGPLLHIIYPSFCREMSINFPCYTTKDFGSRSCR